MNDMTEVHGTLKRSMRVDIRAHFNESADGDDMGRLVLEVWFDVMPDWANDSIADGTATFVYNSKKGIKDYETEVRQVVEARLEAAKNDRTIVDEEPKLIFDKKFLKHFIEETARAIVDAFAEWIVESKKEEETSHA